MIDPLYVPNETQKQEANLVAKLPSEFPILQWETMSTRLQQQIIQKSGLSPQDQWRLLNASTPLQVLSLLNEIQNNAKSGLLTSGEASKITDQTLRYSDNRLRLVSGDASYLPPLQKALLNRQLDEELKGIEDKLGNKTEKSIPFHVLSNKQVQNQQHDSSDDNSPNEKNIEMFNWGSKYPYKLNKDEYYFVEETAVLGPLLIGHTVLFDEEKYSEYKYIGVSVGKSIVPADHIWVKGCVNNVEHVQDYEGPFFNMAGGIGPFGVSASLGYNIDKQVPIISGSTVAQQLFAGFSMSYLDYSCVNNDWVYGTAPISWGDTAYDHALGGDLHLEDA